MTPWLTYLFIGVGICSACQHCLLCPPTPSFLTSVEIPFLGPFLPNWEQRTKQKYFLNREMTYNYRNNHSQRNVFGFWAKQTLCSVDCCFQWLQTILGSSQILDRRTNNMSPEGRCEFCTQMWSIHLLVCWNPTPKGHFCISGCFKWFGGSSCFVPLLATFLCLKIVSAENT